MMCFTSNLVDLEAMLKFSASLKANPSAVGLFTSNRVEPLGKATALTAAAIAGIAAAAGVVGLVTAAFVIRGIRCRADEDSDPSTRNPYPEPLIA
jgi:hypothetical protein